MCAYCRNNPITRKDSLGYSDEDATDEDNESPWSKFFSHMARQRKNGHTFSVGYVYSGLWGGFGAGKSGCIAVDNSYNYALQGTDSLSVGDGTGASGGLVFTYTNADSVQDLRGTSTSTGITLCGVFGIALDYVEFTAATNPQKKCWGISVSILIGAQADAHKSESYTESTPSWNPFRAAENGRRICISNVMIFQGER